MKGKEPKHQESLFARKKANRAALLICCSKQEATKTRDYAKAERRTISSYILNIVLRALDVEEILTAKGLRLGAAPARLTTSSSCPRTAILLRCSKREANRIRAAAERRGATINGIVLHSLRRSWELKTRSEERFLIPAADGNKLQFPE